MDVVLGKKLDFDSNEFGVDTDTFLSDLTKYLNSTECKDFKFLGSDDPKIIEKARRRRTYLKNLFRTNEVVRKKRFQEQVEYIIMSGINIVPQFTEPVINIRKILNFLLSYDVVSYLLTLFDMMSFDGNFRDWFKYEETYVLFWILNSSEFTLVFFIDEMIDSIIKAGQRIDSVKVQVYKEYRQTLSTFFHLCFKKLAGPGGRVNQSAIETQRRRADNTNYNLVVKQAYADDELDLGEPDLGEPEERIMIDNVFRTPGHGDNIREFLGVTPYKTIEEKKKRNSAATKIQSMQRMVSAKKRATAPKTASATGGNRKSKPTRKNKK
jgi:hypothetical protein